MNRPATPYRVGPHKCQRIERPSKKCQQAEQRS
jgi:hypothetical protein